MIDKDIIEDFKKSYLPKNYWLTKSMEIGKVDKSGSLWYLKKWLVFYYYIFIQNRLDKNDIDEIIKSFNLFIDSLKEDNKEDARKFFFEIDLNDDFISLETFRERTDNLSLNSNEKLKKKEKSKSFYFMYLMGIGGQGGYHRVIKEKISKQKFTYQKIEEYINQLKEYISFNIPIKKEGLENNQKLIEHLNLIESDYSASIRNERKLLYYWGLFDGNLGGKTSLTKFHNFSELGKKIANSNFHEIIILWEHQKIKMISQPPTIDFDYSKKESIRSKYSKEVKTEVLKKNFSILKHPYKVLIDVFSLKKELTSKEYKYIISRIKDDNISLSILLDDTNKKQIIEEIKSKSLDIKIDSSDDFGKEIKKYYMGIVENKYDNATNYFTMIYQNTEKKKIVYEQEVEKDSTIVISLEKVEFLKKCYKIIYNYLDKQYAELYSECKSSLYKKYIHRLKKYKREYIDDYKVLYSWKSYINHIDDNIFTILAYVGISLQEKKYDFEIKKQIFKSYKNKYFQIETFCKQLGIDFEDLMFSIQNQLNQGEFYKVDDKVRLKDKYEEVDVSSILEADLFNEIKKLSKEIVKETSLFQLNDSRNNKLIALIKKYYTKKVNGKYITKCDCCSEKAFIAKNSNNEIYPYLEYHHLIPFKEKKINGPDHYLNLFGLCSNCHSKLHRIIDNEKKPLYNNLSNNNLLRKTIYERMEILIKENALKDEHLGFLIREDIINDKELKKLESIGELTC